MYISLNLKRQENIPSPSNSHLNPFLFLPIKIVKINRSSIFQESSQSLYDTLLVNLDKCLLLMYEQGVRMYIHIHIHSYSKKRKR